jgi:peptide chain release factor 3
MKSKHLERALESLAEEGVVQVFKPMFGSEWIVGVVGMLQLDVLQSRLEAEYGLPISFEDTSYYTANWVQCDDPKILDQFARTYKSSLAYDRDEALVALPRNSWELGNFKKEYPALIFTTTKERGQQS